MTIYWQGGVARKPIDVPLTDAERARFVDVQHQANRWTYIGSGMTHPNFLETLGGLNPSKRQMIESVSSGFC